MTGQIVVRDLKDEAFAVAFGADPARCNWVKWVTRVDLAADNTYAFPGAFVNDGTVQVTLGRPRLLLVCGKRHGYRVMYYCFVVLEADGTLRDAGIRDNDEKRGWALRVRDNVQSLLDQFVLLAPAPAPAPSGPSGGVVVRQYLATIVVQDKGLLAQPRRLLALLKDACGDQYVLEQRLLAMAAQEGALAPASHGMPVGLVGDRVTNKMVAEWGIQPALAAWAAETWANVQPSHPSAP